MKSTVCVCLYVEAECRGFRAINRRGMLRTFIATRTQQLLGCGPGGPPDPSLRTRPSSVLRPPHSRLHPPPSHSSTVLIDDQKRTNDQITNYNKNTYRCIYECKMKMDGWKIGRTWKNNIIQTVGILSSKLLSSIKDLTLKDFRKEFL